ncbi:MAG: c-type cytochrome [Anaerolineae bacterium]
MKTPKTLATIVILLLAALLLTACGAATAEAETQTVVEEAEHAGEADAHTDESPHADGSHHDEDMDDEGHDDSMPHVHVETPDTFAGLTNPFAGDEAALATGQEIYATNCVPCHGETGEGDGPAAVGLDPKPADLADGMMISMAGDDYLFWRVTMGGAIEPFNSAMPAWADILTEDQRWQVISYLHTLGEDHHHE